MELKWQGLGHEWLLKSFSIRYCYCLCFHNYLHFQVLYCAFGNRIPRPKCQLLDRQARYLSFGSIIISMAALCAVFTSCKNALLMHVFLDTTSLRGRFSRHHDAGAQPVLVPQAVTRPPSCLNFTLVAANCSSLKPLTGFLCVVWQLKTDGERSGMFKRHFDDRIKWFRPSSIYWIRLASFEPKFTIWSYIKSGWIAP